MTKRLGIAIAVVGLLAVSCSGGDDAEAGSPGTPDASPALDGGEADEVAPDDEGAALGTWGDPLPVGTPVTLTGWEVTVHEVEATAEGPDPDYPEMGAPDDGHVNVVANVDAVRIGDEPGSIGVFEDGFRLSLTNGGTEVGENVALPIEDSITTGDVGPGDAASGWMLVAANVPDSEVDDSTVMVVDHAPGSENAYVATK